MSPDLLTETLSAAQHTTMYLDTWVKNCSYQAIREVEQFIGGRPVDQRWPDKKQLPGDIKTAIALIACAHLMQHALPLAERWRGNAQKLLLPYRQVRMASDRPMSADQPSSQAPNLPGDKISCVLLKRLAAFSLVTNTVSRDIGAIQQLNEKMIAGFPLTREESNELCLIALRLNDAKELL